MFINVQKARNFRCARYSAALRCCSNDVFLRGRGIGGCGFYLYFQWYYPSGLVGTLFWGIKTSDCAIVNQIFKNLGHYIINDVFIFIITYILTFFEWSIDSFRMRWITRVPWRCGKIWPKRSRKFSHRIANRSRIALTSCFSNNRIMEIEEGVRPRRITPSEISIIFQKILSLIH